jgi:hypothetical protein
MSDLENDGFSLADFADIDISGVEEVRFIDLPAGVFDFEVTRAEFGEDEKDGERRFKTEFECKIIEVKAVLEPGVDKESLISKTLTERFFVKPSDTQEDVLKSLGRIRAFLTDIGAKSDGKIAEVVESAKGQTFTGKIVKQVDKVDKTRSYARLRLDPPKK